MAVVLRCFNLLLIATLICRVNSQCANSSTVEVNPITPPVSASLLTFPFKPVIQTSEYLPEYKMGPNLEPNPRTNCPHLQSNLVHWHSIVGNVDNVVLPANVKVLVSNCSFRSQGYSRIEVPYGTQLIFADSPMTLKVRNIIVYGSLHMGSETCRLYSPITINFFGAGNPTTDEIAPNFGSKGIGVAVNGTIDIHGKQYHPTWTRLAVKAVADQKMIYLQDPVNWENDQQIVITTSDFYDLNDATSKNEVRTIVGITNNRIIELDTPLVYDHYAGPEYQSEVGLLSRRIKIFGNPVDKIGGHIMITGKGRVSGVELRGMGQQNVLARYPLHFHRIKSNCPECYFSDNSVVESNFRCYVVHATNNTRVLRNVAYNNSGSCYYIEDGTEENNIFMYNLAVQTKVIGRAAAGPNQEGDQFVEDSTALVPSDHAAASFYITNAYNIFIGNAASGGWAGFAFPTLSKPISISRNEPIVPHSRPLILFEGNTAHSIGESWIGSGPCIYVGGRIWEEQNATTGAWFARYDSGRGVSTTSLARNKHGTTLTPGGEETSLKFVNQKSWLCRNALLFWGERVEVDGYEVHDSGLGGSVFDIGSLKNMWINADTPNTKYATRSTSSRNGFQFYDTNVRIAIANATFKNFFDGRYALETTSHSDVFKQQGINGLSKLSWVNTAKSNRILHKLGDVGSSRYANFLDVDGSLSGTGVQSFLSAIGNGTASEPFPMTWWKYRSDCTLDLDWNQWVCPKTSDNVEVAYIELHIPGVIYDRTVEDPTAEEHVGQVYHWGDPSASYTRMLPITKNPGICGLTGVGGWYIHLNSNTIPNYAELRLEKIPAYRSIIVAFSYSNANNFTIKRVLTSQKDKGPTYETNVTAVTSYSDLFTSDGLKYFYSSPYLYLKLVNPASEEGYFSTEGIRLFDWDTLYTYKINASCNTNPCLSPLQVPTITPASPPISGRSTNIPTVWPQPSIDGFLPIIYSSSSGNKFDCLVSEWTSWSPCSVLCGSGISSRTRIVSRNGNLFNCPHLSEAVTCNTQTCTAPTTPIVRSLNFPPLIPSGQLFEVTAEYVTTVNTILTVAVRNENTDICSASKSFTTISSGVVSLNLSCTNLSPIIEYRATLKKSDGTLLSTYSQNARPQSPTAGIASVSDIAPFYNSTLGSTFFVNVSIICSTICNVRGDLYSNGPTGTDPSTRIGQAGIVSNKVGIDTVQLLFKITSAPTVPTHFMSIRVWLTTPENEALYGSQVSKYALYDIKYTTMGTSVTIINCQVSSWSAWSTCTAPACGGRSSSTRTRTITTHPNQYGVPCPSLTESQICNPTVACTNLNCQWAPWSNWGYCSKTCGTGTQTRTRSMYTSKLGTGTACPGTSIETRNCTISQFCQYVTVYTSDYANSTSGWTNNYTTNISSVDCGTQGKVLRQHAPSTPLIWTAKNLPAFTSVKLNVMFGFMDSWESTDYGTIKINGVQIWRGSKCCAVSNICFSSGTSVYFDYFMNYVRTYDLPYPTNQLQIEFNGIMDSTIADESMAIGAMSVQIAIDPTN
eukprot:TRINITY_DN387_c1_g1_i6.p1 TRINITY_DN387_c1_g1~~TRINITY_DN387_c1_g1_i6.p1  ORF type:complete len:1531 (+),score=219.74 TRINITY_DN387_c1_g1_i6:402-4994(+)